MLGRMQESRKSLIVEVTINSIGSRTHISEILPNIILHESLLMLMVLVVMQIGGKGKEGRE